MAHMGGPNGMANGGMTQVPNIEVERHIRQNNERLRCIQRHLQTPEGFEKAAKELLEWCSDQRAFQKAFEPSLMNCLTVISEVATKPGFNLNLGYQLLARCSSHRDKFSPKSSNMLRFWSEDLGNKLLILQHQKRSNENMKANPSSGPHMGMGYNPMAPRMGYPDSTVWNTGNGPNQVPVGPGSMTQRQQHHSVSVTTTVWGVTNTTQTPPIRGQSHPPINQYQMGPGAASHSRIQSQNPGYHMNNYNHQKPGPYGGPGPYQRPGYGEPLGGTHRGMPGPGYGPNSGPHQGHHMGPDTGDYPPPAAAAAAAAVAAAAATATATATAMVVNDQQHQQQNDMYDQMGPHRGSNMHPMDPNGNNMTPGPMMRDPSGSMGPAGGRGPMRPNMIGQYGQQGKPMGPPGPHPMNPNHHPVNSPVGGPNHGPGFNNVNTQYRPAFRQNSNSYGPQSPYDAMPRNQFKSPPPSSFSPRIPSQSPHQGPMLTATPDLYSGAPSPYYPNSQPTPNSAGPIPTPGSMVPTPRPPFNSQYGSMYRGPPQQHPSSSPMPGAPTPPITPGSAHNVPPYPGIDVKPSIHSLDVKPVIPNPTGLPPLEEPSHNPAMGNSNNDEMRMTFPVRDGIVLESFRLEHNRSVSTHAFHLRNPAYDTLRMRVDLELQFKCYHHDDSMQYTNWPHSVQVTVNNTKMEIPRHPVPKPLYLRRVCRPGRNTIEITVSTCCCSHLFVLQLVHRPSVRSVLMGLLQKRMLPACHCVTKIKRYFSTGIINGTKAIGNGTNPNDDTSSTVVSLRCPITHKRINLPARGNECKHIQCFDLEAYLQLNSDKRTWKCPICNKSALLEGLEVDQYVWGILKESHPEDMEVIIDSRCHWKSVTVKREVLLDEDGPPNKRFRSNGMSLSTMFNHLPSPGSYVPQMNHTRLTLTPDMQPPGMGFPQSSGGCGFQNRDSGPVGQSPGMSGNMGPMTNGMCAGMGPSNALSPNNGMGMRNNMNNPGTLHRANPLHLENIAADDMVTIEKRLNHAMANNNNMAAGNSTSSPNRPTSNQQQQQPLNPMVRSSSNSHLPQSSGTFPSPHGSTPDTRMRNTMSAPSNPNPSTPGNPATPSLLSPPTGSSGDNSLRGAGSSNSASNAASNSIVSPDVNFDAEAAINGSALADSDEKIPTLDLPQLLTGDDSALNGLFDYLGPDPGEPNEEDIFSLFDP